MNSINDQNKIENLQKQRNVILAEVHAQVKVLEEILSKKRLNENV